MVVMHGLEDTCVTQPEVGTACRAPTPADGYRMRADKENVGHARSRRHLRDRNK